MNEIIIIDDEQDLLELSVDAFALEGISAKGFSDPVLALEYLQTNRAVAIISDANMPRVTGLQLFQKLKEMRAEDELEFFFLCTGQIDLDEEELLTIGITKVIQKPYDILDMIEGVKTYLKKD